jgi:predicted nucleic acid-binding protein
LDRWALEARWGAARQTRLQEYLERFVVFPYDRELCTKWAEVTVATQSGAATALLSRAPLLTYNHRDYLGVPGLALISRAG